MPWPGPEIVLLAIAALTAVVAVLLLVLVIQVGVLLRRLQRVTSLLLASTGKIKPGGVTRP